MQRQVGLQGERGGKEIGEAAFEQFQFDLADGFMALALQRCV